MVAILPWRPNGPSQFILFEIALALRSRKPLLVFVDERLPNHILPARVLQQRFSHRTYFHQIRDQIQAIRVLKSYMGDPPPARYQPSLSQKSCGLLGLAAIDAGQRDDLVRLIEARGYSTVGLEETDFENPLHYEQFERLAVLKVVLCCADSPTVSTHYWAGAVSAASIPAIKFTCEPAYRYDKSFPMEFQPRLAAAPAGPSFTDVLSGEFDLFEQSFLSAEGTVTIERYVDSVVKAGLVGRYEEGTRNHFIGEIVEKQINIQGNQGSVVYAENSHVHDVSSTLTWNQMESKIDLAKLADELALLHDEMMRKAKEPEEIDAAGKIGAAAATARQKNGPKTIEYLRSAGKWALTISIEIGVAIVADVLKSVSA